MAWVSVTSSRPAVLWSAEGQSVPEQQWVLPSFPWADHTAAARKFSGADSSLPQREGGSRRICQSRAGLQGGGVISAPRKGLSCHLPWLPVLPWILRSRKISLIFPCASPPFPSIPLICKGHSTVVGIEQQFTLRQL